jgi:hypothetical protein
MCYYVLCMRISTISIYVRTEMCTNNKFVSTLIWKPCFHTDMKTSRSIVCQTNMHLIMRIENAFKFCGFTFTTNGFLFFFIVKMENVGLSVHFHWALWKSSRPLIYLMSAGFGCSSDSSMVSFGNPLRIFRFPPSLIQLVLYIVHVHRHQWYLGLLDWIVCSCPGRYSPLQSLLMFGVEFVPRSVVLSPVCTTL